MNKAVRWSTGRRDVVRGAIAAGLGLMPIPVAIAQTEQRTAADFIRRAGRELASLAGSATDSATERQRLGDFIDRIADVDGVARFCLGRFWVLATDAQRQRYLAVFHRVLLRNVITWVGTYQAGSTHVAIGKPVALGGHIDVPTVVQRPGEPPAHITWVVTASPRQPKIVDLVVEGISMRLTERNDYASYIEHNNGNIDALIRALERQAGSG